jgi:uncharacterized membrane protein YhaH (DUF805 family)
MARPRGQVKRRSFAWGVLVLGVVGLAVTFGSIALSVWAPTEWEAAPLAAGTAGIGISFFVGVLILANVTETFSVAVVRHAIAAAFVATFLYLFGVKSFFAVTESTENKTFASDMLDLFGDLLKIIIPFYFIVEGAAAGAVRYQKAKGPSESEPTASETASASAHHPGA